MSEKDLRRSPTISHLLDALEKGTDIGHYGRLTLAMAAHHFVEPEQLVHLLVQDRTTNETEARSLVQQVTTRGYNPPKRERIIEWQQQQEFPICPNPDDPDACNLYRELELPDQVFENIEEYHEQQFVAQNAEPEAETAKRR